jgi:hypothetical protein
MSVGNVSHTHLEKHDIPQPYIDPKHAHPDVDDEVSNSNTIHMNISLWPPNLSVLQDAYFSGQGKCITNGVSGKYFDVEPS